MIASAPEIAVAEAAFVTPAKDWNAPLSMPISVTAVVTVASLQVLPAMLVPKLVSAVAAIAVLLSQAIPGDGVSRIEASETG
jgi:hypothetical protein